MKDGHGEATHLALLRTHTALKKSPLPFREAGSYLGDAAMFPLPFSQVISPYRSGCETDPSKMTSALPETH